eukprot:TRINITY_DN75118_c0_g1_i1.p1 TRINITY_DN75118_c0_g1~~TRINITY_DN75118_c0_g1_i1.p1  ORF type:complete len:300 (-),score=37.80 TRINITY_DN75118_c0_g1_i1:63-962(-)
MRSGKAPTAASSFATLDRYGAYRLSYDGRGRLTSTSSRTGCGAGVPDYGPATNDFSFQPRSHPTNNIYDKVLVPFSRGQVEMGATARSSESSGSPRQFRFPAAGEFSPPQQFRHPQPEREALMSSTTVMPYRNGGRRKVGDDNHWKAAVLQGPRRPIWSKGTLLEDTEKWHIHPMNTGLEATITNTCSAANLAAGAPTTTAPAEAFARTVSCPSLDAAHSTLLSPSREHGASLRSFAGMPGGPSFAESLRQPMRRTLGVPGGGSKLPSWIAHNTIGSRDLDAAGHACCGVKKLPIELQQ